MVLWGHKLGAQCGVATETLVSHDHWSPYCLPLRLLGWERQVPAKPFGTVPVDTSSLPTPTEGRAGD